MNFLSISVAIACCCYKPELIPFSSAGKLLPTTSAILSTLSAKLSTLSAKLSTLSATDFLQVMAEIELASEDEPFEKPDWIGEEVSGDRRYYNSMLTKEPYSQWTKK